MKLATNELFVGVRRKELGRGGKGREVQMLYRVGENLKLWQAGGGACGGAGQIMAIDCPTAVGKGDVARFLQQVQALVQERGYRGVCCLFPAKGSSCLTEVVRGLGKYCEEAKKVLLVTEGYGEIGAWSKVMISTAISGGSLEERFRRAVERYGRERVVMDIDCMREDVLIPSPQGSGERLTEQGLRDLRQREGGTVFFSQELCSKYFSYQNGENSLRFVLFDDEKTVREKIRYSKMWNLYGVAVSYEEVGQWNLL